MFKCSSFLIFICNFEKNLFDLLFCNPQRAPLVQVPHQSGKFSVQTLIQLEIGEAPGTYRNTMAVIECQVVGFIAVWFAKCFHLAAISNNRRLFGIQTEFAPLYFSH